MRKIAPDKWKHFFVGILMGAVLEGAGLLMAPGPVLVSVVVLVLVIAISYGFELFSKFSGYGHYDFIDAVAGAIGGAIGMGVIILIYLVAGI
jgi:VanZ family protein